MTNIIFAQPRHFYDSYRDWHDLIRLSGFEEIYIDEIPSEGVKDNIYICTPLNGEWERGISTDARVVLWDLEYRREPHKPIPGVSDIWHMDKAQAALIGARYAPVGGHSGLRLTNTPLNPAYDVAYYGYMIPRRQRIQTELREHGLRSSPQAAWGDERDILLSSSLAYLHIHQWDDIPAVPGLRMVVAAAYGLPVIAETCADAGIFDQFMRQFDYNEIVSRTETLTRNLSYMLRNYGDTLHQILCEEFTFRKSVEAAL